MRKVTAFLFCLVSLWNVSHAQLKEGKFDTTIPSIHQEESDKYKAFGEKSETEYDAIIGRKPTLTPKYAGAKAGCELEYDVYGWHPYWMGTAYNNYRFDLLSTFSWFSYELEPSTGGYSSIHGWNTTPAIDLAIAAGCRVELCVTNFGSSNNTTFLTSSTARQNLIDNLITLLNNRGAHGVNIDFEGVSGSQRDNLTSFMTDLSTQLKAAIPGATVTMATYSVDWNDVFDFAALNNVVDKFIIMGYGYYYGGSTKAGPTDNLYSGSIWSSYNLVRSINYHLESGVSHSKLVLGLPYYGYEWETVSNAVPSSTTGNYSSSRTFKYIKDNTSGNYSNKQFDTQSYTPYYIYQNSGNWRQAFVDDEYSLGKRYEMVKQKQIGGIGIWALGYDDTYDELWNLLENKFTTCAINVCSDTLFDMGGPFGKHYNKEDYEFTIQPDGASKLAFNFTSFELEAGYDSLWIYDGTSTAAPLIGGYSGTTSPGSFLTSGNSVTFKFKSDVATIKNGWEVIYNCVSDNVSPTTSIGVDANWETADFNVSFTDADAETGVAKSFYQVLDNSGTEWRANSNYGFFNDNFDVALNSEWTSNTGTWSVGSSYLNQTDQTSSNTNLYTSLAQNNSNTYLYHWQANMSGTGTNRRSGIHFFCDNATLPNRGNSYFVYYRVDNDRCQIYKVVNDSWVLQTDDAVTLEPSVWYDFKVSFDPSSGKINCYANDALVSTWTDPSPHQSGSYLSLRTGNTGALYNDVKVYKSRGNSATVSIGSATDEVRYQNSNSSTPSCRIKSLVVDQADNWSTAASQNVNIDWTSPSSVSVYDGSSSDLDTMFVSTTLNANWTVSTDAHSDLDYYKYCVGTIVGDSNVVAWTLSSSNSVAINPIALVAGNTYYTSVVSKNGAGLWSTKGISDGVYVIDLTAPICSNDVTYCSNQSIANVTATPQNGGTIKWFSDAQLSNQIGIGSSITPSNTIGTTAYYAAEQVGSYLSSADQVQVTVELSPSAPVVSGAGTFCEDSSISNLSSIGSNVSWYSDAGLSNLLGTGAVLSANTSVGTHTYYTTQSQNGCASSATNTVQVVNAKPIITTTNSTDVTGCFVNDGTISITASGGTSNYTYSNNGGSDYTANGGNFTNLAVGTYSLKVFDGNCYSDNASEVISGPGVPSAPVLSADVTYCDGETIAPLTATAAGNVTWYNDAALTSVAGTGNSYTPSAFVGSKTFYAIQEVSGCFSPSSSVDISVYPVPVANFSAVDNTLELPTSTADFVNTSTDAVAYEWNFGDGSVVSTDVNPSHVYPNEVGVYSVTLTAIGANCPSDVMVLSNYISVVDTSTLPMAQFTFTDSMFCAGESLMLTNTSTDAYSYQWLFPGANITSSTATNGTATYTTSGLYEVTLIAYGSLHNDTITKNINIVVEQNPAADFTADQTTVYLPGATVNFTSLASNATSYLWNFGDGNFSTEENPTHEYAAEGTYTIVFTASNGACSADVMQEDNFIAVIDATPSPSADFYLSENEACAGNTIAMVNASQNASSYLWAFPAGVSPLSSTALNPEVVFPASGEYSITLTASSSEGSDTKIISATVNIFNNPVADFYADPNTLYLPNNTIYFSNNSQNATSYQWNFGNGSSSTDANPWSVYANTGSYSVTLTAANGVCADDVLVMSNYILITTTPALEPTADFEASEATICLGEQVSMENLSSNASTYKWFMPGTLPSSSTQAEPVVNFTVSGNYIFTLIANGSGGSDTITKAFDIVVKQQPVAEFTISDTLIYLPDAIAGFTNDSENADNYLWSFGDGNSSTYQTPWNEYATEGYYDVMLIASNGACSNDTLEMENLIHVMPKPNGTEELSKMNISVYPNPVRSELRLEIEGAQGNNFHFTLYDLTGKKVISESVSMNQTIDVKHLADGMYCAEVNSGEKTVRKRIIINK